jgi:hypothetical protein
MSAVVAEVNHFVPERRHPPAPSGRAAVAVRLTSEPPVASVIHCPEVHASRLAVSRGTYRAARSRSCSDRTRAAPSLIDRGQSAVAETGLNSCRMANCTTRRAVPKRSSYAVATTPASWPIRTSSSQAGSTSIRSTRRPQPSNGTRRGGFDSARSWSAGRSAHARSPISSSSGPASASRSGPRTRSSARRNARSVRNRFDALGGSWGTGWSCGRCTTAARVSVARSAAQHRISDLRGQTGLNPSSTGSRVRGDVGSDGGGR